MKLLRTMLLLRSAVWMGFWICLASPAIGQNPFGRAGNQDPLPGSEQVFPPIPDDLPKSTRLVLESLRSSNPSTPADLATAVGAALDIEQFPHAKHFLVLLNLQELDDAGLYQLSEQVGSDLLIRIHGQPELQPEGQSFAKRVMAAARSESLRPERLEGLIRKLSDPNNQVRSQAFRELRGTGPAAVAAMLNVFGDYERKDEFVPIRNALRSMEDVGIGPFLGGAKAGPMQVRYESLTALARIQTPEAHDAAVAAYFSPATPAVLREALALGLENTYGQLPQETDALRLVAERAREYLKGRRRPGDDVRLDATSPYVIAWRWNPESRQLEGRAVPPEVSSKLIALDRASDLHAWQPESAEFRQFYLVCFLDAEKRLKGPMEPLTVTSLENSFPDLTATEVDQAVALAISQDMLAAAAGGCDLLRELASEEWLISARQTNSGLLRSLQSGDRHLQYSAFRALTELDPHRAYLGNSYVLSFAVYLASYGNRPSALVACPQMSVAQDLAVALGPAGIEGRSVTNGRELIREATSDSNVRYLFLSEDLARPGLIDLVQQLRSDWRTKRMPIALLTSEAERPAIQRLADQDPRILNVPLTTDVPLVALQVQRLQELEGNWVVSNEQAQEQSAVAIEWLKKITADRNTYRFYEISSHYDALNQLLFNPAHTSSALEILGNIATPQAQRALVDYASQSAAPIELRQLAVASMERAVAARGLLLTTDEIRLQYARYNSSTAESGESQRVLGSLLDMLERRVSNQGTRAP